ncbi:MAG TPA: NAD-dependent epimerase/dehydratase family protein, partial [Terriglobia bacterium]|nr:NAD-dependent epimerase/dehydratase family protein [Terriglobia bacterium]
MNPPASATGKKFLITGAKGFIGAWTVKNLVERGDRPCVLDLDTDSHRLKALLSPEQMQAFTFIHGDVTSFEDVERAVARNEITHIIHFAALQVPACAANPRLGAQVNVVGTLNVFEAARAHAGAVKKVVYASSAAVFGPEELYGSTTVPEGAPLEPTNHYGIFKQCNEGNARIYFKDNGLSSAGLRPWAVYGVGRDVGMTSAPTKAIKAAVIGRPYTMRFTGGLDLQYVNDTARIAIRCAELEIPGARVYTLRGAVVQVDDFLVELRRQIPSAKDLIRAEGKKLSIAYDLDDSALARDLGDVPR